MIERIVETIVQFLRTSNQYGLLPEVIAGLEKERYRNQSIHVTVAAPLREADEQQLRQSLLEKWGEHYVVLSTDPSLLSGMLISFNGTVLDTTGKQTIQQLSTTLE